MERRFRVRKEPSQSRAKETVDVILQSVVELVERGEPRELTTTRIAERAGVSVGSLYQYFPSKESIFSRLIEHYLEKECEQVRSALASCRRESLEGAVDSMIDAIIRIRTRNLGLERALMRFFARAGDPDFLKSLDDRMIAELDATLSEAAGRGLVARTEASAFLLFHLIRSTFLAATLERPDLYAGPELRQGLRKAVLALLRPEPT